MSCITTAINLFFKYHNINERYCDIVENNLRDGNYTIYTRKQSIFIDKKISVKEINYIDEIEPNTMIGIYIKPNEYLNVNVYHYFYIDNDYVHSSWKSTRPVTIDEYNLIENKTRSFSETSIETENIDLVKLDKNILYKLMDIIKNDKIDVGNDIYQLFGGNDNVNVTLDKSKYKIKLYMFYANI